MMLKRLIVLAAVLLISACSRQEAPAQHDNVPLLKLSPAALGTTVSLAQRLTVSRLDGGEADSHAIEALLEIDPQQIHLAGFVMGQRILTLSWDGQIMQSQHHPRLPSSVDGDHVLRDIELVYWPLANLNAALPSGWVVREDGNTRVVSQQGVDQVLVQYADKGNWNSAVVLENRTEGYRLNIESKRQDNGDAQ